MLTQLTIFLYIVAFLYGIVIGSFFKRPHFPYPEKREYRAVLALYELRA